MKDVKQKHQQKLIEQKIQEEKKIEEEKYLASVMKKKRYNWREKLNEQMTTSDVFFTTLPATGNVDLNYPSWNALGGYNYDISGGTVTITNSGVPGPESGIAASFDTSVYDTLVIDVGFSGDTILGVFPSGTGGPLLVTSTSGSYSISVPQSKNQVLVFLSATLSVGTVTINNLRFQRRTPLNVFVSLDSPEATSFIRTGSGDLSAEERKQKIKEMLEASDEYVQQMYGDEFPGTGAVPPGEYDPFKQAPPGEAGDTPGVEIAALPFIPPEPGPSGYKQPGTYDPKQFYPLDNRTPMPSPNLPQTGPGLSQGGGQDTQIAQILHAQQQRGATGVGVPDTRETNPGANIPPPSHMIYPKEWLPKQAKRAAMPMVASYEPQGQVISEKKKLKSPEIDKKVRAARKKPK